MTLASSLEALVIGCHVTTGRLSDGGFSNLEDRVDCVDIKR